MFCHWTTWNSYVAANDNSGQNHRKNKRTTQHCILILLSCAVFDKPTISCSSSCKGISLFLVKQNKNVPSNEWCKVGKTFLCSKSSKDFRILKLCCCCLYNCRIFVYDYWTFPSLCQSKIKQFFARRPTEITHKCSMDSSLVYLWGVVVILPFSLIGRMLNHSLSCVQLFVTSWTVAHQAPPSMGFSRQEYWSGLPFPSPGDLPHPGIKPRSPTLQADALTSEPCWLENRISSTTYIVCINCTPTFTAISYKLWYL